MNLKNVVLSEKILNNQVAFSHHHQNVAQNYNKPIEGIMPEGRINRIIDLQETKFL